MTGPNDRTNEEMAAEERPGTYYPVALDLRGRACLIIGGGAVALRKAGGLIAAGADVTIVAPECLPMPDGVTVTLRPFVDADLDGVALAMAATDDRELNARVARLARERGVWVNVADDPEAGDADPARRRAARRPADRRLHGRRQSRSGTAPARAARG